MRDLLADLTDAAGLKADYADARFVRRRGEHVVTRNGALDVVEATEAEGIGVRVRVDGAWGFAAAGASERADLESALDRALALARAQPRAGGPPLVPEPPSSGAWSSPLERDPFEVPLEEKLAVLHAADAALRRDAGVAVARAEFRAFATETTFASSDGALFEQRTTECGGGVAAVAVDEHDAQRRSFPASHGGGVAQAGFEHFLALGLPGAAPRVAEEAVALLRAPPCPTGRTTLILGGEQLALQIHESIGHAVELDRVLGREASYAGTSFLPADGGGRFRVGSEAMAISADATVPGGLGTFRWDDEGVAGQAVPIVRDGVLRGFLSSRETAAEMGLARSGGCMRADGFERQPLVRMTNVNLEPGDGGTLEELVAATERGVLIDTNRSWSIDSRRLRFRFEGEAGWLVEGGRRGRLVRNPSYAGTTPTFWGGLDAVCSASEWRLASLLDCGKGEPGQYMHVSHGCAPARFRDVELGVA